jgi:site-specific recombinase XerD
MAVKDFSTLEIQPLSAFDLQSEARNKIIISAVSNNDGSKTIISSYGDECWELGQFFEQSNRSASEKRIDWTKQPLIFRESVKAVLYRYWMVGRPGLKRPVAGTVRDAAVRIAVFLRYLEDLNVKLLKDVTPLHISNFVQLLKDSKTMRPKSINNVLQCIELLYIFRDENIDSIIIPPWGESNTSEVSGLRISRRNKTRDESGTPVIPKQHLARLFEYAENILTNSHKLLDERDMGLRFMFDDQDILRIRDACFFLLGLLTGMRCDEIVGVEINAGRSETKEGFTYNWVKSIEHKTKKGNVEYLVSSMGINVLNIMERWSQPHRLRLHNELSRLEKVYSLSPSSKIATRILNLRTNKNRIFMSESGYSAVSGRSWGGRLKMLANHAGVDWDLAPHQLRRTYARTFVQHRLGNVLLLKDQFKHSTLDMTQLYAANPMQDEALLDECLTEIFEYKIQIINNWLDDSEYLTGGAGKKIVNMRPNIFSNRASMLRESADKVSIRSTGHSWCLSQSAESCGGQGLYERTRCAPCGNSVIDSSFQPIWQEIYLHQLELRHEAKSLGPGVQERVERDLVRSRQVLTDLGVKDIPSDL